MASALTLDTNAVEHFEFEADGYKYRMRFANTEETLEMADMEDAESIRKLFNLVEPASEGAPSFSELMANKNQVVLKRFADLYQKALKNS